MKRVVCLSILIIALALTACSKAEVKDEVIKEKPVVQKTNANEQPIGKSQGNSEQEQDNDKEGNQEGKASGEQQDDGNEKAGIQFDLELTKKSWVINGALLGDTRERIKELFGEPVKAYGDERYDYSVAKGKLMVVFDDNGVSYFQVDTTGESGKLLDDALIQKFTNEYHGNIYKATDEMAEEFNALSIVVYVGNPDSILVVEKHHDEKNGTARTYMLAPEHGWSFSRSWNLSTFQDQTKFTKE